MIYYDPLFINYALIYNYRIDLSNVFKNKLEELLSIHHNRIDWNSVVLDFTNMGKSGALLAKIGFKILQNLTNLIVFPS